MFNSKKNLVKRTGGSLYMYITGAIYMYQIPPASYPIRNEWSEKKT